MSAPVVSRFAPSPTGFSHLGGARTALFAWLSARAAGGAFLLRIEDTDIERSEQRYTEIIIETLAWLGLSHDAPIIYQSQRADLHRSACEDLIAAGAAYWCACSPERL
ncbi:MAG: glutamate--tRNA ligase, partial [Gammaproteobacteria bacterium AqS3]|nr:glutamate--tRNA ligase [Gammaproteobacteria bacterium AqS3]